MPGIEFANLSVLVVDDNRHMRTVVRTILEAPDGRVWLGTAGHGVLRLGQEEHRFPLGEEEIRVRHALG